MLYRGWDSIRIRASAIVSSTVIVCLVATVATGGRTETTSIKNSSTITLPLERQYDGSPIWSEVEVLWKIRGKKGDKPPEIKVLDAFKDIVLLQEAQCAGSCQKIVIEQGEEGVIRGPMIMGMMERYTFWHEFLKLLLRHGYPADIFGAREFAIDLTVDASPFWGKMDLQIDVTAAWRMAVMYSLMVKQWHAHGNVNVWFTSELDGFGRYEASWFSDHIGRRFPARTFGKCFEWCSGPGFIGFYLLAVGICDELVLADINPKAVEFQVHTAKVNGLQGKVTSYVSDNFNQIPPSEKFDLIVSNPPYYFGDIWKDVETIEKSDVTHTSNLASSILRLSDPGYHLHRRFYGQVSSHLNSGALVLISEDRPFDKVIDGFGTTLDVRSVQPVNVLKEMGEAGGLVYHDSVHPESADPWFYIMQFSMP